ncbi:LIM domain transcription factor LMO4-like [Limulus polyphemus]|uniref:LIM domain transcription factor LMO4-like n=1 Tax=Limulus polyphemus TaxID=6850 RepID=A0ABM1BDL1_LIMPO|nr:LIM domain transcription factor LMO4-like [Limulus polyphemus]
MNPGGQNGDPGASMMSMMNPHNPHGAGGSAMTRMQSQPLPPHHGGPHHRHPLPTSGTTGGRSCGGCGGKILDRFLLHALDRYWHTGCLKCSCCQATLADIGSSCFTKAGMILCKNDYIRMFGSSGACSACGQIIPANEFVMRTQGNVYHLKCFACVKCHNQLNPGDRYNMVNGNVLCEQDCLKILKSGSTGTGTTRKGKVRANAAIKAL